MLLDRGSPRASSSGSQLAIMTRVLTLAWLFVLAACRTVPASDEIPQFRQGVASVDQRTEQAFAEINAFDRQRMVEYASSQKALGEALFEQVLEKGATDKWKRAFGLIDQYSKLLQELLDPNVREGVHTELVALGEQFGKVRNNELPAGVASGFATLGGLLVQMKAEKDALAAIRAADPGIQATFASMASAIGENDTEGIRAVNAAAWLQVLKERDAAFRETKTSDLTKRREIATLYASNMDERDAQDRSLDSIRRSLELLGQSHAELAEGRTQSAASLLALVNAEYARWSTTKSTIEEAREAAAEAEGAGK